MFAPRALGGLPSIIYGDVSHGRPGRIAESNCVYSGLKYGRDSKKRRAASFFCRLFSPVSTSCAPPRRRNARADKREQRSYTLLSARPLFGTGFLRKERKTLLVLGTARYIVRTCIVISEHPSHVATGLSTRMGNDIRRENPFPSAKRPAKIIRAVK